MRFTVEHGADLIVRAATGALPFDVAMGEYQEHFVTTEAEPKLDTASLTGKLMTDRGIEVQRLKAARKSRSN